MNANAGPLLSALLEGHEMLVSDWLLEFAFGEKRAEDYSNNFDAFDRHDDIKLWYNFSTNSQCVKELCADFARFNSPLNCVRDILHMKCFTQNYSTPDCSTVLVTTINELSRVYGCRLSMYASLHWLLNSISLGSRDLSRATTFHFHSFSYFLFSFAESA